MSSCRILRAGSVCLLVFLFACNNQPEETVSAPPSNAIDSSQMDTAAIALPVAQSEHTHIIEISKMKFNPDQLTIPAGDTVVWVNNDITNHCVTEVNKAWTSGPLTPTQSFKEVITKTADYFCAIHVVMKGRIDVQ